MHVQLCMYINVRLRVFMRILYSKTENVCMHVCFCASVCLSVRLYVCKYVSIHLHINTRMYACMYDVWYVNINRTRVLERRMMMTMTNISYITKICFDTFK